MVRLFLHYIGKSLPGVKALDDISSDIRPGDVHDMVGENEGGNSSLVKILAGEHPPDEGECRDQCQPVHITNARGAPTTRIVTLYVDTITRRQGVVIDPKTLVWNLSIAEQQMTMGAASMGVRANRLVQTTVSSYYQQILTGITIVLTVAFDSFVKPKWRASSHDCCIIMTFLRGWCV